MIRSSIVTILFASPAVALGHHSMAEFDRNAVTELEGTVLAVTWRNPHILLDVETRDANGTPVVWSLEGGAVSAQRRRGVTDGLVEVGEQVRVAGWASSRRPQHMLVNHVLTAGGVELLVGSVRESRWSAESVGSGPVLDNVVDRAVSSPSLFKVWSQGTPAWFFPGRVRYPLTPDAAAAQANWDDIADNPLLDCTPPGMPSLVGNPYPMQFIAHDGNVELRFEEFDAVRTIHLEDAVDPETVAPSPLGYSVGKLDGNVLQVRTTRINWPYFNRVGAPQSEAVVVDERFEAADDGMRLDYVLTVTDPEYLTEPFVWEAYWTWQADESVGRYDCTVER